MSQSLAQIYLHIVYATKSRVPFLSEPAFAQRIHAYLAGIARNLDSPALRVGGVADHVHLLLTLSRGQTVSDLVRDLKRDSTKWIKAQPEGPRDFAWQEGYGAFSVSPAHVEPVTRYIQNQPAHHQMVDFQTELRKIFDTYHVTYDERYVWD